MIPGLLLAVAFTNLLAFCTGVLALVAAAVGTVYWRAADAWKEERDAEREKADRLEKENTALKVQVADLRAKTDLSELDRKIDALESGMAGGFASLSKGQKAQLEQTELITQILRDVARTLKETP